jgi:hypothetical protein
LINFLDFLSGFAVNWSILINSIVFACPFEVLNFFYFFSRDAKEKIKHILSFAFFVEVLMILVWSPFSENLLALSKVFHCLLLLFSTCEFPEKLKPSSSLDVKEAAKSGGSDQISAQTFAFRELAAATRNFRADSFLGEGGFGRVYKGRLENTCQVSWAHYICTVYKRRKDEVMIISSYLTVYNLHIWLLNPQKI